MGENITGTADNDTFRAVLDENTGADADDGTLNVSDEIDGGAGTDTLNLTVFDGDGVATGAAAIPAGVDIKNVEIINLQQAANTLAAEIDANTFFPDATQIWQIDGSVNIDDLEASQTAGFRDTAVAGVTAADGATSITVALDGATTGGTIDLAEETADDVTTASISGSVGGAGALTIGSTGGPANGTALTSLDTLNLSLTSDGTITVTAAVAANLETLDGSGSTGDITTTIAKAGLGADATAISFGDGNDSVTFVTTVGANENATSLTLGAGDDVVTMTGGGALTAATDTAELEADLITITDFAEADDALDISGIVAGGARIADNVVNAAIAAADPDNLFEAVDAAFSTTGSVANDYVVFAYEGDTYIGIDSNASGGLNKGDDLIQLTGISVSDLDATNFVA